MWILQNDSMVSVVAHRKWKELLLVRARRRDDLINAIPPRYVREIFTDDTADYQYRCFVPRDEYADHVARMVRDCITYTNFKDSVDDPKLKRAYSNVWHELFVELDRDGMIRAGDEESYRAWWEQRSEEPRSVSDLMGSADPDFWDRGITEEDLCDECRGIGCADCSYTGLAAREEWEIDLDAELDAYERAESANRVREAVDGLTDEDIAEIFDSLREPPALFCHRCGFVSHDDFKVCENGHDPVLMTRLDGATGGTNGR